MLDQELAAFETNRHIWREKFPGRYLLVKGSELVAAFETQEDALAEGARQFGLDNFLVRNVNDQTQELHVPALTLGLLHADSPSTDWANS